MIENWEVADIKIYNEQMEFIIPKVVEAFAAGPPLYGTFLPDKAPVDLDVIQDGKTSGSVEFENGVVH